MEISSFAALTKVRILIGKGGVGKTAVSCALAQVFCEAGLRVLLVELEGRPDIPRAFGQKELLEFTPRRLQEGPQGGFINGSRVRPDDALVEYLADHGLGRLAHRLGTSGLVDVIAGAIPGIKDILVLGKIKQMANEADVDVILLDAPATGHAVTLLTSAAGLADAARSGPVRRQADEVVGLLSDPTRCQVTLVTIPEELPVTETIEAAFLVEDKAGVALGPVIANRVDFASPELRIPATQAAAASSLTLTPELEKALNDAASFQCHRADESAALLGRLRNELPLPVIELPRLRGSEIGPDEVSSLAASLRTGIEGLSL